MGLSIRAAEERIQRLDAKIKQAPGQMGFDFSAPPPAGKVPKGGGGTGSSRKPKGRKAPSAKGGGTGQRCGGGWIDPRKECHKGGGGATGVAPDGRGLNGGGSARKTPQIHEPLTVGGNQPGWKTYNVAAEKQAYKGGLRFWRSAQGRHPAYFYFFRDRNAVEHWLADDNAKADADMEAGSDKRRSKEWQAEYKASYESHRNMYRETGDYDLLKIAEGFAEAGKATRVGTVIDVRIAGNKHSRPIRDGFFDPKGKKEESPPATAEPVLTNPGREDPGLAPKPKPTGISANEAVTAKQQADLARQQQQAAREAGDDKGAQAWKERERAVERERLAGAMQQRQQSQTSLFGVTEYDETMPLFRGDSIDPVAQLCGQILREQLPGAQVLDWSAHPRGITAGRAAAGGLVYRFRLDAASIGYRPAWDGVSEQQWEHRSEGFLLARDPAVRLDAKARAKFRQTSSKRKCGKGYGCGSACISLQKECRTTPKTAIGKLRLSQLQALAKEGDSKAAATAQQVQLQRNAQAEGLRKGRQVKSLEKMLQDPAVAEMVRTGKVPTAAAGAAKPGQVRDVKPDEVEVDADRFQYKIGSSATGEVGSLSGVRRWDPNLAGVISVWQDPADGKTYVVNGHNRLALAKRLGAEEVTVRYLKAKDAKEARAIGALQNIAEGAGSEIDAGKFFRDTGVKTLAEVEAKGLPLRSGKAQKGLALAQLPDEMFDDVVHGRLRMRRAAVIGASGLDQDKQREVYKKLKATPSMTDETLQEYVEHLEVSTRQTQGTIDVFGTGEKVVDNGLARAELASGLKKALGREARLLSAVSKSAAAVELLEQRGGNTINVEQSQQQAGEASTVLRTFDQLKSVSGPVADALNDAATRVTNGENKNKVMRELRAKIIDALEEELKRLGLKKPDSTVNEAPTMSIFDRADRFDSLLVRIDALKRKCQTGYACGSTCISADKDCRSSGKATTGKERLKRLEQAAQGGSAGRGIGRLRGESAAAKAGEIRASRAQQAAALRQQRGQQRGRAGALAIGGRATPEVITPEVITPEQGANGIARRRGRRPGSIADLMQQGLDQLKASDARHMGMLAEQLFETSWKVERRTRFPGMSKDQARDAFKADFVRKMQEGASSPEAAARQQERRRKVSEAGSLAGAMKVLLEEMKQGDQRLEQMGRDVINARIAAEEIGENGDGPALGGSTGRRRLGGRRP